MVINTYTTLHPDNFRHIWHGGIVGRCRKMLENVGKCRKMSEMCRKSPRLFSVRLFLCTWCLGTIGRTPSPLLKWTFSYPSRHVYLTQKYAKSWKWMRGGEPYFPITLNLTETSENVRVSRLKLLSISQKEKNGQVFFFFWSKYCDAVDFPRV